MTRLRFVFSMFVLVALVAADLSAQSPGSLYDIDRSHSLLDFTGQHVGFGRVRGTFTDYQGTIYYPGGDATNLSATIVIDAASIDTRNGGRDGILRNEFFQVEQFPVIEYQTQRIEAVGGGYQARGTLTIRDVSQDVVMPIDVLTLGAEDQFGHRRIALGGRLTINRNDFGVFYRSNNFWDGIVSDSIAIEFEVGARVYNSLETVFPWRENQIGTMVKNAYEEGGLDAAREKAWVVWNEQNEAHRLHIGLCAGCGLMHRLGVHLMQQGKLADAEAIYALTAEIYATPEAADPVDYAHLLVGMAEVQFARGNREAALATISQALEKAPASTAAREFKRHLEE